MGLERPSSTGKNVVRIATGKANLDCWELEWTQCWDVTHEVDDGHIPLARCSRTLFFCTPTFWKVVPECKVFRALKPILVSYVDGWETFVTNCEEIHNNLSKFNFRSHVAENCIVAMILGLRQALTRIGCVQAFESGPTVEEPCPAEMADYDKNSLRQCDRCIASFQIMCRSSAAGNQVHDGDDCVHALWAWSRERTRTHSDWDTLGPHEQGRSQNILSSGQDWLLRRRRERRIWI